MPEPSDRTGSAVGEPEREGATLSYQHGVSHAASHKMHYHSSTEILAEDSFKESRTRLENDTQEENPRPPEASEGAGRRGWAEHEKHRGSFCSGFYAKTNTLGLVQVSGLL